MKHLASGHNFELFFFFFIFYVTTNHLIMNFISNEVIYIFGKISIKPPKSGNPIDGI